MYMAWIHIVLVIICIYIGLPRTYCSMKLVVAPSEEIRRISISQLACQNNLHPRAALVWAAMYIYIYVQRRNVGVLRIFLPERAMLCASCRNQLAVALSSFCHLLTLPWTVRLVRVDVTPTIDSTLFFESTLFSYFFMNAREHPVGSKYVRRHAKQGETCMLCQGCSAERSTLKPRTR